MRHYQRIQRYMGYTVTFEEFGGMWQARIEAPDGKVHRTGYALEYEYAARHAQTLIDKLEAEQGDDHGPA